MTMNTNAAPASILKRAKRGLKNIAPALLIAVAAVGFSMTLPPNAPQLRAWDLSTPSDPCKDAENKAQSECETAQAEHEKSLTDLSASEALGARCEPHMCQLAK